MYVKRVGSLEELQQLAACWNSLAREVPFRSWQWLSCWWRAYGEPFALQGRKELFVLAVIDDSGGVVGIAPWYIERSRTLGRVIRFLGTGEVCSDYLSVLCQEPDEAAVVSAIADTTAASSRSWQSTLK